MSKEGGKVVMDFDGTVTDLHSRSETYLNSFVEKMAKKIGMNESELKELVGLATQAVINHPENYAWRNGNGTRVSAATDIFLITQQAAESVLKNLRINPSLKIPPKNQVGRLMTNLFAYSRPLMEFVFQPGVGEFIDQLKEGGGLVIVTNSGTDQVKKDLGQLMGLDHGIPVVGNARKYFIDEKWSQGLQKEKFHPYPYPESVSLQRPLYYEVLTNLGAIKLVMGDMSELDLFLPQAMGIPTALKRSPTTPYWEVEYYDQKPQSGLNRFLIGDYSNAMEVLGDVLKR